MKSQWDGSAPVPVVQPELPALKPITD